MVARRFSNDFVLINADKTAKDAFNLIKEFSPKYIIISRADYGSHFHYVFEPEDFNRQLEFWKNQKDLYSMTLKDFMDLHEPGQNQIVNTKTISEEPNTDPEIMEISDTPSDKPTIIVTNDIIVGVVEDDDDAAESAPGYSGMFDSSDLEMVDDGDDQEMVALARGPTRRGPTRRGATKNTGETKVVKKEPTATLPKQITINETAKFEIIIKTPDELTTDQAVMDLVVDKNEKTAVLTVFVRSEPPGFVEFPNGFFKEMEIPLTKKNSKPLVFDVRPIKEGWCTVIAQFHHKNISVGEIGIKSKIIPDAISSESASVSAKMDFDPKKLGPDLSLLISEVHSDNGYKFEILLQSLTLALPIKRYKPDAMQGDVEEEFRTLSADLADFGEDDDGNDLGYDYERIEANVADKGKLLYNKLFTKEFKDDFWEIKDKIKSIQVISQEPWIPWEIIKPVNDDTQEEEEFWCEKYNFTRWIEGIKFKPKPKIKKIKVILPKDTNLKEAKKEIKWINTFADSVGVEVTRDSTWKEVMKSLKNGGFDLLHCTTHGLYNENLATMSHIELEGRVPFTLESISGRATAFGKDHPLVIFNACETGQQGFALIGTQSWAKTFLEANASAFIGTLWSVGDITAKEFTKSLYEKLHDKEPLDKAVRLARIEAKQRGDVSWLSYTLYAPSNTPIVLGN